MKRKRPRKSARPVRGPTRTRERSSASPAVAPPESPARLAARTTIPVVGIGASAGGLEAFSQLLRALPGDTGMAFVLVQHLDPTHESLLPEVLSRTTAMPVEAITDGLRVKSDHVYVIPSNTALTIDQGAFALTPRDTAERPMPIDHFFRSLAREQEGLAIGVVLSGTGSDGTLGLRAIKAEGGITFVQDEKSARHPGMPQSAAVVADFVLPPAAIARELARISGHPYVNRADAIASTPTESGDGADLHAVLRTLRTATGVDFTQYKAASVRRRIARRMLVQRIGDLGTYARHIRETPREAQALHDDLLIQVTEFFRDPEGFEALRRSAFPSLVNERPADEPIRVWVPGCATGEEAYSLVMCLQEFLEETGRSFPIQLFATDLSSAAIARARAGMFAASIENELSADRLRRFFVKTDGRYQVSKAIREACVFAPQNVTNDPPFSKLDLISCCNVLIYLNAAMQERVIPVFHYALKPHGFLKLGLSEGVGRATNLFSLVDRKYKIYERKPGPAAHVGFGSTSGDRRASPVGVPPDQAGQSAMAIEKEADRLVLGRYAPAGVIVSSDLQIVQFRGKTSPYLEIPPGAASHDLLRMVRPGLAAALREAMQRVVKSGTPVRVTGLRIKANGASRTVGFEVTPLGRADGARSPHHLVLFFDDRAASAPPTSPARRPRTGTAAARRETQLSRELTDSRQHLQAVTEEHDAVMEELRAAAEEAQSSNEELQSTNEELETAKEELQATNEELTTVNDELSSRNTDLRQLSDDLGNVLSSVHVPVIMVGPDLRIRRMTPVTERILGLSPNDVGRPIGDFRLGVEVPQLEALTREVIDNLTTLEREVEARDGRWYAVRVRPYRTVDNKIDGAVIVFVDIDAVKRGFDQAKDARDQAQAIIATVREPLVLLDADLRVLMANRSFYEAFQVAPAETEQRLLFDLGNGQWNVPQLRRLLEEILPRDTAVENFEVEHVFEGIGPRTMLLNARRVLLATGRPASILLAIEDVTEIRRLERERAAHLAREQTVRELAEAASSAKDRFVAVLSHELRTPLNAMLGWARLLRTGRLDPATTVTAMDAIERNTILQSRLIEDLLDVSRIVAGTLRLDPRPMTVAPAVEAAVTAVQPTAAAKGVVLERVVDEEAGVIQADPVRLQQIVWNLVSNAVKFTPSGGRVDVRLARVGADVEISVRDTGMGIDPEHLAHIFSRFGAAHTTSQSQGGLGLGLAIVHHLVGLHGGTVRAESAGPGEGATFTVTLPLTDARASDPSQARRTEVTPTASAPATLAGVRVLVVDDVAESRELLRAILEECGAEVTDAESVQAALRTLEQAPFDVLISDIAMPGDDGYALIRRVRSLPAEHGGQIPAVALTAYARIEDRAAALEAGYHQHAAKPIEPSELSALVAVLAGRTASEPCP